VTEYTIEIITPTTDHDIILIPIICAPLSHSLLLNNLFRIGAVIIAYGTQNVQAINNFQKYGHSDCGID
jgi:hypothetical protein